MNTDKPKEKEEKSPEQIVREIVGLFPVPGYRKWSTQPSKEELIVKAMQIYADQELSSLRDQLKEKDEIIKRLKDQIK